ncbi:MAG: 3-deoxy-D-manno-octulosonic acid transferase [Roseobacter sp.]
MGRSLSLAAYRALARRTAERDFKPASERPKGALVWIHAAEADNLLAVQDLAQRLCAARFGLSVVITLPDEQSFDEAYENWVPHASIMLERTPSEHPDAVVAFWNHLHPDMVIWAWGDLRPNLVSHINEKKCPIALIDAETTAFGGKRDRWLPDLSRNMLEPFVALMVRSSAALKKLEALGLKTGRIDVTPPLKAGGYALPCEDSDLSDLSAQLRGRPVWLASSVQQNELETVLAAHKQASRMSHRLLFILHPAFPALVDEFKAKLTSDGIRFADWTQGDDLDDATQVLIASEHHDLGLFYRISPVSFMGGSLRAGYRTRNPFEAAALGSAVLYGPNVRHFMPFYSRLAKAGAARIINDSDTLGAAVMRLIAPDQAATMAHAGWDVVSQGAALTDRVIDLVQSALDGELDSINART